MPTNIDNKVVQMTFDNKQFERGVRESMHSLEELKRALDLDRAADSLSNLEKAAAKFDISGISAGVDKIADKFTLLGNIGQEVFHRISKTAVDAMEGAWRTVTNMPKVGMSKYEQKNKAVQMIQGALPEKSIEEIEEVLGRLNRYTDLTSYDFSQMANSIGKFTAAGVDLDVAERVMEGIANEAASAGGEIQQANIAMYNFSQALAAGSVKALDWKSIENQNLATKEFKETIIDTAAELGILQKAGDGVGVLLKRTSKGTKQIVVNFENFRETLSDGWFTSDVLIKTMEKYADRESEVGKKGFEMAKIAITMTQAFDAVKDAISTQWMKTWQFLLGDLEEAGSLFTSISDSLIDFTDRIGNFRNSILEGWHTGGEDGISGYQAAIDALSNSWHILMGIAEATSQAFKDVFGEIDSSGLIKMTTDFRDLTKQIADFFGYSEEEITKTVTLFERTDGIEEWSHIIEKGMKGSDVENLQKMLLDLKNPLIKLDKFGADGIFGPETQAALKAFQKEYGIAITGVYDKDTRDALAKALYPNGKLKKVLKEESETITHIGSGLELLRKALRGVFSIGKAGLGIIKLGLTIAGKIITFLSPIAVGLMNIAAGIGDLATYVVDFATSLFNGESAISAFQAVLTPFSVIVNIVGGFLSNLGDGLSRIVELARKATNFEDLGKLLNLNPKENKNAIAIYNFLVKIKDIATKLKPAFENIASTIKSFFVNAKTWLSGKIETAISNISTFFTNLWKTIKEGDYPTKILNGIATVLQVILGIIGGVGYGLYSFVSALVNGAKAIYEFAKNSSFVKDVLSKISSFFEPVKQFFSSLWTSLTKIRGLIPSFKTFEQFWSSLMAQMASNPIGSKFVPALTKVKKALSGPIRFIGEFVGGISTAINAIKKFGGPGNALTELMKDPKKNSGAINVLKFLKTVYQVLAKIAPIVSSVKQAVSNVFNRVAPAVKEFGSSIWESIKNFFGGENGNSFDNVGGIFDNIVNALTTAWNTVSDWVNNTLLKSPFVQNLKEFGKLFWESIKGFFTTDTSNIEGLGPKIMKRLEAFNPVIDWIKEKIGILKESLSGEGGILDSVKKFFSADEGSVFGVISNFVQNVGNFFIEKGLDGIWDMATTGFKLAIITMVVRAIGRISKTMAVLSGAAKPAKDFGKTVLELAVSIGIIAGALWLLAKVPADKALAGVGVMTLALGAMVGAMYLFSKFGRGVKDVGVGILSMCAGLALVVLSIRGMYKVIESSKDPKILTKSLIIVGGIIVALGTIAFLISKFGKTGGSLGGAAIIAAICLVLIAVVHSIEKIAKLIKKYPNNFDKAFEKIEIIIGILGGIAFVISKWGNTGGSFGGALMIIAMCLTISAIVRAVGKMAELIKKYPDNIDKAFWMVEGILITIGGLAALITGVAGSCGDFFSTIGSIAPILAIGWAFEQIADAMTKAIVAVKDVDVDVLDTFMGNLVGTIAVLSAVCVEFAAIPLSASLKAALAIFVLVTAIGASLDVVATFAADALDKLSSAMWLVGSRLRDFSDYVKDFDILKVGAVMLTLTKSILPSMAEMVLQAGTVTSAKDVAKDIWYFGLAMGLFKDSIGGLTTETGNTLKQFATDISEVVTTISGITGIQEAKSVLTDLGGALALYYGNLRKISIDENGQVNTEGLENFDVNAANTAFQQLADLTLSDETLSKISSYATGGEHDLSNFAVGIENIGTALKDYGDNISKLDSAQINNANSVLDKVGDIEKSLNSVNSWGDFLSILSGKRRTIADFGLDIAALGAALSKYGGSVSGLNFHKIAMGNLVMDAVVSINNKLPKTGGLSQILTGEKSLGHFATNISDLGTGLASYATKIKDADMGKVTDSTGPIDALADINDKLDKTGGLKQLLEGKKDLSTLGDGLAAFGEDLMEFYSKVETFDGESKPLKDAIGILGTLVDIQSRIKVLEDAQSGLGLAELSWEFAEFFDNLSGSAGDGATIRYMIESGIDAIRDYYTKFKEAGKYLDEGLAAGLIAGQSKPINAAAWVAAFTLAKALRILGIRSPSTEFEWAGRMADEGLANGLTGYSNLVGNATDKVANMALDNLTGGLKGIQDIIESDFDETVTITPVLDLTNVESASSKIRSMLSNQTVNANASKNGVIASDRNISSKNGSIISSKTIQTGLGLVNGISRDTGSTIINTGRNGADVAVAINSLNERMNQVVRTMTNLKIVVDSGALVGQIAGPMDRELGARASRSMRRG